MSENEPTPEAQTSNKRGVRIALVIVALLVVAVVVNWKDINAIASGRKTFRSVLYGKAPMVMQNTFRFPEPMGPEDAKVKVLVVAQEGNGCHEPLVTTWMGIGDLEPERLRIEFGDVMKLAKAGPDKGPLEIGCDSGAVINGENKFLLGEGDEKRTLYLTGPTPSGLGTPENPDDPMLGHGWSIADVAEIVNLAIEEAYGEKGDLTAGAIQEAAQAARPRLPKPDDPATREAGSTGAS